MNETAQMRFPLKFREAYRLVTPAKVDYDIPASQFYQQHATVNRPITAIIIHTSPKREENFVYRIAPRIQYAPRFTAEVITPIVRCINGEKLVVRLTNHSRDGVADKLGVRDSIVYSNVVRVALSKKEKSQQDTLTLTWYNFLQDSSYLVPIEYGGVKIAQFLARKFYAVVDTTTNVGIITGRERSQTVEAIRRLGLKSYLVLSKNPLAPDALEGLRTVIIDRRAMTLRKFTHQEQQVLLNFTTNGGHLIILAQDAESWNSVPLWDQIRLIPTGQQTERTIVQMDSTDMFLRSPNVIAGSDFDGWLLRRAYNIVNVNEAALKKIVVTAAGNPLLVTVQKGKGRITYVDLALTPQFMNVHPGAMRLLANLISRRGE